MKKEYSYGIIPISENNDWSKDVLIIQNKSWAFRWFPKWHKKKWENPIETAKRELFEETWLRIKQIISLKILEEVYLYQKKNWSEVEKHSWYFVWEVKSKKLKLQEKEIKDALRLNEDKVEDNLTNESSKKIFQEARKIINPKFNQC